MNEGGLSEEPYRKQERVEEGVNEEGQALTTSNMLAKSYYIVKQYESSPLNLVGSTTALVAVLQVKEADIHG